MLNEDILTLDRVEPVGTVGGLGSTQPLGLNPPKCNAIHILALDGIPLGILYREIFQGNIGAVGDAQALGSFHLTGERQDRAVHSRTADHNIFLPFHGEGAQDREQARFQSYGVPGLCQDELQLKILFKFSKTESGKKLENKEWTQPIHGAI